MTSSSHIFGLFIRMEQTHVRMDEQHEDGDRGLKTCVYGILVVTL